MVSYLKEVVESTVVLRSVLSTNSDAGEIEARYRSVKVGGIRKTRTIAKKQKTRRGRRCAGFPKLTSNREEEVLLVPSKNTGRRSASFDVLIIQKACPKNSRIFRSAAMQPAHGCH